MPMSRYRMPTQTHAARALDTRVQAAMWAAAGSLCAVGVLLAQPIGGRLLGFGLLTGGAALMAAGLHLRTSRPPSIRTLQAINALASSAACLAIGLDGDPTRATEVILLWPALYSAYFFSGRALIVQLLIIGVGFGIVSLIGGMEGEATVRIVNILGAVAGVAAVVWLMRLRLESTLSRLRKAAKTDALTSLLNRRGFDAVLERELHRSSEREQPLTLVVGDLDHFKGVNDGYGHDVGDRVLVRVGAALQAGVRDGDVVARIGGEEFAIVLPGTGAAEAGEVVERLRAEITAAHDEEAGHLSMSFGIAEYPSIGHDRLSLLQSADRALYAAKAAGRDCVLTA